MRVWSAFEWLGTVVQWANQLLSLAFIVLVVLITWSVFCSVRDAQAGHSTNPAKAQQQRLWHVCAQCRWKFRCRLAPLPPPPPLSAAKSASSGQPKSTTNGIPSAPKIAIPAERRPCGTKPPSGFRRRCVNVGGLPIEIAETSREPNCCQTTIAGHEQYFCSFACYRRLANFKTQGNSLGQPTLGQSTLGQTLTNTPLHVKNSRNRSRKPMLARSTLAIATAARRRRPKT